MVGDFWRHRTVYAVCCILLRAYISLLTIEHRFPFFPMIFAAGLVIAWFNLNDNHHMRILPTGSEKTDLPPRPSLADAFPDWLKQRTSKKADGEEFPVFVITAQGGGLYAAHNAA